MEGIKMKTTKTNKSEQFINVVPIIYFILLAVIMTLYSNFSESGMNNSRIIQTSYAGILNDILPPNNQFIIPVNSEFNDDATEKQSMSFIIPMKGFCLANQVNQNLETDKLIERNKDITNLSLLAEKLREYLIPEDEPELEFVMLPFVEKPVSKNIYIKNEYLENLREIKIAELEMFYALQLKCREYLVEEIEPPLELEEWMCDESCWCFGNNTAFAMNEK